MRWYSHYSILEDVMGPMQRTPTHWPRRWYPLASTGMQLDTTVDNSKFILMEDSCNCGDTRLIYYPDENQHEPACWECYYNYPSTQPDVDNVEIDELPF